MNAACSVAERAGSAESVLLDRVLRNRGGEPAGIYAVCSAHPLVLEAAVDQALADGTPLLIEATANQVNQFGGYTGMQPADFRDFVLRTAEERGLDRARLFLGGDHLGPVCWTAEPAEAAMLKAEALVAAYATAGFAKIHLDCSMPCADDPATLSDLVVAGRAARLCAVAERAAFRAFGRSAICYVIGTEVPPPGGADEDIAELAVTDPAAARRTLAIHEAAFAAAGMEAAWRRVIALVVQPGVEFDHGTVIDYVAAKATALSALIDSNSPVVFEAHSTDYQLPEGLAALVRNHFAVLKVGPGVTFALREALFALDAIERELVSADARSNFRDVCEATMVEQPGNWQRYYHGDADALRRLRAFSLSDRIRYYWPAPAIAGAQDRMFANLRASAIPLALLGQYLPQHLLAVRRGTLACEPEALVRAHVRLVLADYARACWHQVGDPRDA